MRLTAAAVTFVILLTVTSELASASTPGDKPHILQRPSLSAHQIVFVYAGDLWTVDRAGGVASRLTTGVGLETAPVYSPDGATIAFTGEYDGNIDVFTVPAAGGVPYRVTYHPSVDVPVSWTRDGRSIIFRSDRESASRYTKLFAVPARGGLAKALPLPMAHTARLASIKTSTGKALAEPVWRHHCGPGSPRSLGKKWPVKASLCQLWFKPLRAVSME